MHFCVLIEDLEKEAICPMGNCVTAWMNEGLQVAWLPSGTDKRGVGVQVF